MKLENIENTRFSMSSLIISFTFPLSPVIFFDFGQFTSNNELNKDPGRDARRQFTVKCLRFLLMLSSLLFPTGPAAAQQIGDADQGLDMASKVCSECHAIRLGQPLSPQPDAPRFQDIADSGLTTNMLVVLLRSSHPTMPNIMLSDTEVANVVEYIRSLRRD